MPDLSTYPHCQGCSRPMRPRTARAADHPGTVFAQTASMCVNCRRHEAGRNEPRIDRTDDVVYLHMQGFSDRQIAEKVGMSRSGVASVRQRHGIPPNVPKRKIDLDAMLAMFAEGKTAPEIAAHFGVHPDTVRHALRNAGKKPTPAKRGPKPKAAPIVFVKPRAASVAAAFHDPDMADRFATVPCARVPFDPSVPDPMSDDPAERAAAAERCAGCPLARQGECGQIAKASRAVLGVWGGRDLAPGYAAYQEKAVAS